jgi:hypothetical protein
VDLRRSVQALDRCRALREFRNELYRLQREQERFEKAQRAHAAKVARLAGAPESVRRRLGEGPRVRPADQERMAVLARLRQSADRFRDLEHASAALEDRALLALHGSGPAEQVGTESSAALRAVWEELLLVLYRREFPEPDAVTLALFGEDPGWLTELAAAHVAAARQRGLAVEMVAYLLPDRTRPPRGQAAEGSAVPDEGGEPSRQFWRENVLLAAASGRTPEREVLVRESVQQVDHFLAAPPDRLPGLALRLRGPGAAPCFAPEQGLHILRSPRLSQPAACLAESSEARLADYLPPPGISRRGAIGTQTRRRTYDRGKEVYEDPLLGKSFPWENRPLGEVVAEAVGANLRRVMLSLLEE